MELDPELPEAIQRLNQAGWRVVVASAGCDWYIGQLLNEAGVDVQVYANPGHFEAGKGLLMRMPADASIASPTLGVDKTRIVRSFLERGLTVAFAGDGLPDSEPVRLVPAERAEWILPPHSLRLRGEIRSFRTGWIKPQRGLS